MNLGRVKSFLIVLFLGINIYLIAAGFFSSRFYIDKDTVASCAKVLKANSVTLSEEAIPRYTVNLRGIDTENVIYTNDNIKNGKNGFEIHKDSFCCRILTSDTPQKAVMQFLEKNGFRTGYMNFFASKSKDTWYITCSVKGYKIFDNLIKVTKIPDGYTLEGKWYEPITDKVRSQSRQRNTVYITSVLVDMLQNKEIMKNAPFEITRIDYGYLAGMPYGGEEHITTTALPYYRIRDNKGNSYYFEAESGQYLNITD